MTHNKEYFRLKKQAAIYVKVPVDVIVDDSDQHFCTLQHQKATITIGKKAPYKYAKSLHEDGYDLFMEGLNFHEIACLLYTDFPLMKECFDQANEQLHKTNLVAKKFLNKEVSAKEFKDQIRQYVFSTNLPLLLKAIEDGATENSIGIEHPETWTALMFARHHISLAFINHHSDVKQTKFLMDKIIKEIMVICTYGYRHHLYKSIQFLPTYLSDDFEEIRRLAIKGRLQSQSTKQRKVIAEEILKKCQPIMDETVMEIFDTVRQSSSIQGLGDQSGLFSSTKSEISVSFQNSESSSSGEPTKSKYQLDLSEEDFRRIEQMENQEERDQQHRSLQEILRRERDRQIQNDKSLNKALENRNIDDYIINFPLQRNTPTDYGHIALRTLNQSIQRSNKLARLLKRAIMYSSKNRTKRKLEYGRKLDQRNLYRATIDGRVFYEHIAGNKKDICVYILVDNSESMSGDKIVNTMRGCYEVARVLQTLKIPFCISSHKAVGDSVQMTEIIPYKECMKRQLLERIFFMHVSGGTHEEIALEKALKELTLYKRNKKGFVFVLSDGDTHGVKRIHELTHAYKKDMDIDVIGIGIQTAKKIETTYPQGMFIEDINQLPTMLVQKLRDIAL